MTIALLRIDRSDIGDQVVDIFGQELKGRHLRLGMSDNHPLGERFMETFQRPAFRQLAKAGRVGDGAVPGWTNRVAGAAVIFRHLAAGSGITRFQRTRGARQGGRGEKDA